ncbi:hypothetical protein KIN20_024841 [Parelaphostrongylus tenuis]|uniref:Uncharacterized protein n=1 Tax=Parelaphostrongylus tenuis TaxID=148309 RepID=A0AAD5MU57_PARTN|nr:hypothetical protein KIN20_024841 [Parelaphostrongylus tenuis]
MEVNNCYDELRDLSEWHAVEKSEPESEEQHAKEKEFTNTSLLYGFRVVQRFRQCLGP